MHAVTANVAAAEERINHVVGVENLTYGGKENLL